MPSVLSESIITLIRKLHVSNTWVDDINSAIIHRLKEIKTLFPMKNAAAIDITSNVDEPNQNIDLEKLCSHVWSAMAVIGGFDRGLRMGGFCKLKSSGKRGIVLGIVKPGIIPVKVQWEPDGEITDVSSPSQIDFIEPPPFNTYRLVGLTPEILTHLSRLSGITDEITMPIVNLTKEEEELLVPENFVDKRSQPAWKSSSDSKLIGLGHDGSKGLARTMESLTDEMVSSILDEVKRISEKIATTQSDTRLDDIEAKKCAELKRSEARLLQNRLLKIEANVMQLSFLQFAALKCLHSVLTSSKYSELFLVSNNFNLKVANEEMRDVVKNIMRNIVEKSIEQSKLRNVVSMDEMERAASVLHANYIKCKINGMYSDFNDAPERKPAVKTRKMSVCSLHSANLTCSGGGNTSSGNNNTSGGGNGAAMAGQMFTFRPPTSLAVNSSSPWNILDPYSASQG